MSAFLHTNPHNGEPWYSAQHGGRIEQTSDTRALVAEALRRLQPLWRQRSRYAKAGLMLDDLRDGGSEPVTLFPTRDPIHWRRCMP